MGLEWTFALFMRQADLCSCLYVNGQVSHGHGHCMSPMLVAIVNSVLSSVRGARRTSDARVIISAYLPKKLAMI
jgi:hypothetical protein